MYEYYLPFIGKKSERLYHRVSADSIRAFAQAIGEENPVYLDEEYAKTTKYGRMILSAGSTRDSVSYGTDPSMPMRSFRLSRSSPTPLRRPARRA